MKIDNFALTTFQSCPAKYLLRIKEGWSPRRRRAPLGFGGALHAGLAEWYRGKGLDAALAAIHETWPADHPVEDYRTLDKCVSVMKDYARQYPTENWKIIGAGVNPLVERTFTISTGLYLNCVPCGVPSSEHGLCPKCNQPCELIEYGGIFDGGIEFNGALYVLEHKSTSMLGSTYFNQFNPNNQVTGYIWGLGNLTGRPIAGALINAIGVYKSSATKFERSITNRSEEHVRKWLLNVQMICQQIRDAERTGKWPMATGSCTTYGMCEFHSVHTLAHDVEQQKRLETDYQKDPWSYEDRDD